MELLALNRQDIDWAIRRMPAAVRELLKKNARRACVAGGFLRSCIANEAINDVDIFAANKDHARAMAAELSVAMAFPGRPAIKVHVTDNAYTVLAKGITPQIIHRWTFEDVMDVTPTFDFTIACAMVFWCDRLNRWEGFCAPTFYQDLAAKRLVYRAPEREEEPGGSMLRVLKFYQRGYRIPLDSLARVMARCCKDIYMADGEEIVSKIITGRLVEVDPVIDPSHAAHLTSTTT